jgi:hypothetical protein
MEGLAKINELIAELVRMEQQEERIGSLIEKVYRRRIREALEGK